MKKILIEVILTNQCNKRCDYCDLDFRNQEISEDTITTLTTFISNNSHKLEYFHINFFGGEPLLKFSKMKKIVDTIQIKNIKYSIGTNGNLLTQEILDFLIKHNFSINLSVDNITGLRHIPQIEETYFDNISINFINDPDYLSYSRKVFLDIFNTGYKKINFMPVFSTKKWERESIIELGKILKFCKKYKGIKISPFSYFNGIASDIQFILDTDAYFYNDLDSLLWLQKQYHALDPMLKEKINMKSKNLHIGDVDFSLEKLLSRYNEAEVIDLVLEIPKSQGYEQDYRLITKVLKHVR